MPFKNCNIQKRSSEISVHPATHPSINQSIYPFFPHWGIEIARARGAAPAKCNNHCVRVAVIFYYSCDAASCFPPPSLPVRRYTKENQSVGVVGSMTSPFQHASKAYSHAETSASPPLRILSVACIAYNVSSHVMSSETTS